MRVAVMGFGSVWCHRLGKGDARSCPSPVYYNTTGVLVHGNVRQRPQICGYARFDTIGGFDPNHPSRMIGRVFECAEPAVWMGSNKLLFKRILNTGERTDRFLISVSSALPVNLRLVNKSGVPAMCGFFRSANAAENRSPCS